jgi:hypothetical protein
MHLTGITKRASCLIAVREPAQPVADTPKSEVNRTTAKLPGRNITAIPPLRPQSARGSPDASENRMCLMTVQLWFQSWREYKSLQRVSLVCLVSTRLVVINRNLLHTGEKGQDDAKNARVTLVTRWLLGGAEYAVRNGTARRVCKP